ncbi:MAG TPA: replication-relaxation family protein [Longimicrobium sp.]
MLLSALDSFRIVDRRQAAALMGFTSIPRVNARLLQLTRAGYLARDFIPVGNFGRRAIYRRKETRPFAFSAVPHQFALNDLELVVRRSCGDAVRVFRRLYRPLAATIPLVPDAYGEFVFGSAMYPVFFEVDLGTESRKLWRLKAHHYVSLALSGEFQHQFGHPQFRVAVLAPTARRLQSIREAVAAETSRLFFFSSIDSINSEGVLAQIWLRSEGSETLPLV